ncbi:MAG TPA: ABC transporter permease [Gemmatales bacterium]|nr:ABC transporter permease [Gemmatales bacterium]
MAIVFRTSERSSWWWDVDPAGCVRLLWRQRHLIGQLVRREVIGRYRGSLLGTLWMILLPIISVLVYAVVFGLIFKQRWPGIEANEWTYPLVIWAGLALFNAFAEVVQRATSVIAAQPNLVKKVVFPLDVLPVTLVGTSLVPLGVSILAVTVGILFCRGEIPNLLLMVMTVGLFLIWLQGIAWFLAGVGTFLRDLGPMVQAICPLMLFVTPIFYPISMVPDPFRLWFWSNPLAVMVETMRAALLHSAMPPMWAMAGCAVMCLFTWQLGSFVFARLRSEMADVV